MTLQQLVSTGSITLVVLFSLVQISPLKINPWTWIAQAIGRAVNAQLVDMYNEQSARIDSMEEKLQQLSEQMEYSAAMAARQRILTFSGEIGSGKVHTKEMYEDVMENIDIYENYCKKHESTYINNKATMAIRAINQKYEMMLIGGGFSA